VTPIIDKLREALDSIQSLGFPQRFEAPLSEDLTEARAALDELAAQLSTQADLLEQVACATGCDSRPFPSSYIIPEKLVLAAREALKG